MRRLTVLSHHLCPAVCAAHKRRVVVAAAQILTGHDVTGNLQKVLDKLTTAAERGCEIVLFHEGALTGYPDAEACARLDFDAVVAAEKQVIARAAELRIAVLLGSTSRSSEGDIFNDVLIIDEGGCVLGRYAKTWRAGEPHFTAGSGPVIFTVAGVTATVLICHDLRYPELTRLGVAAGAQIVFMPNNEAGLTAENKLLGYRSMQISRATENMVYGVMCNAPQDQHDMGRSNTSHGNSMIVEPLGKITKPPPVLS